MIETVGLLLFGILVILVIIAANGYFVAQEFAYMSVDRVKLAAQAKSGDKAAARALKVTQRTSFMLSGAQLGITVTGLLVGFVAEPLVGESLGVLLGGVGVPAAVSVTVGTVVTLIAATVIQMIFGELFPKNLAIASPDPLARALAPSTLVYLTVFGWLISVFDHSANLLLKLLRIEPVHDVDTSATARDLERIIYDSRQSGNLPEELSIMLDRILDFPQQDVEHAMIPRSRVGIARPEMTVGELRGLMAQAHTRYPVIGDDEQPLGVVHLVDVLSSSASDESHVESLMRPPLVLPTVMSLPDALAELTSTRNELACVIDEYGGFAGVLTLEDLAEEVVGEITDEHDEDDATSLLEPDDDGIWIMEGDVHLDEVERAVSVELPRGEVETIAGLLIAERGSLPEVGEIAVIEVSASSADLADERPARRALEIEVLEIERHVPSQVRVRLIDLPDDHDGDADASAAERGGSETSDSGVETGRAAHAGQEDHR